MTTPLIIQIQEAVIDSESSLADPLRKAKVASTKLGLSEFEQWLDKELGGYIDVPVSSLPKYRKLYGTAEALNSLRGWLSIQFHSAKDEEICSFVPFGLSVPEIEQAIRKMNNPQGFFVCEYPPETKQSIRRTMNYADDLRIRIGKSQAFGVLEAVRNILLNWTIEMERNGIIGEGLMFTKDEKAKSAEATAHTITNFNIQQVGALVQNATGSAVHGQITATHSIVASSQQLVPQLEALLAASNLPPPTVDDARRAIDELKEAANSPTPDTGRIQAAWAAIKRVCASAGETVLRLAVDAAVTRLFGQAGGS